MKKPSQKNPISDDYIAGFVDGEGCFALSIRKDVRHERKSKAVYYGWKAHFVIALRADDFQVLEKIRDRLGVGNITYSKNSVRYQVGNLSELEKVIVPFFETNRLFGKKGKDFQYWTKAIKILSRYKKARGRVNVSKGKRGFQKVEWKKEDLTTLKKIQERSARYKGRQERKWQDFPLGRE